MLMHYILFAAFRGQIMYYENILTLVRPRSLWVRGQITTITINNLLSTSTVFTCQVWSVYLKSKGCDEPYCAMWCIQVFIGRNIGIKVKNKFRYLGKITLSYSLNPPIYIVWSKNK